MNTLLQIFTKKSRRYQGFLTWGLAIVVVIGISGLLHHFVPAFHQVFAQTDPTAAGSVADAAARTATTGPFGIGQGVGNVVASLATLFIKLLAGILWFVLYWMGDLMDNTFILEGSIGEKLHSVWVIVRNFVNIFFALALVVVALMSVLGVGDESGNYGLKKFIPKMALALIAVNFTFFACRIILDINNVLTTAIFDIPRRVTTLSDIGPTGTAGVRTFRDFKCLDNNETVEAATRRVQRYEDTPAYKGVINQLGGICFAVGNETAPVKPDGTDNPVISMGTANYNQRNFVWAMATQFQGLHNLNKVSQLIDPTFTGLTVNALFSIIFAVIYGTAYIAMFIILIARMCVLWICIMLSPLVAISIVFPELLTDKMDIQQQFLDHAFVPVKMAIPLALGYILISQMQVSIDTSSGITEADKIINLSEGGQFARGVSITTLMYGVSSIAVIWFAVFTASEKVVGHGMVESLKGYVETAGSTVAKWPTYLPIFPVSGTMASVSNLQGAMGELQTQMREAGLRGDRATYDATIGKIFPRQEFATAVKNVEDMVRDGVFDAEKARSSLATLAAAPDPARFNEMTRKLVEKFPDGSTGSPELATVLGAPVSQFRDPANIEAARLRLQAPGGGTRPTAPTADFSQIQRAQTEGLGTISLAGATTAIPTESVRTAMGFTPPDSSGNSTLNLKTVDLANFMSNLSDSTKVPQEAFRSIVMSSEFEGMTGQEEIRAQLARMPQLLSRIRQLVGTPGLSNDTVRNKYLDIVTPPRGDRTSRDVTARANSFLGIPG